MSLRKTTYQYVQHKDYQQDIAHILLTTKNDNGAILSIAPLFIIHFKTNPSDYFCYHFSLTALS